MADRRDLAALVVAFLVAAGCTGAGLWQLDRLRQRRERNAVARLEGGEKGELEGG